MDVYAATFLTPSARVIESVCSVESSGSLPALIAVGFEGGAIQLLEAAHLAPIAEIPSSATRSVRRLVSIGSRLFSAGVHGQVTEWDLSSLSELYSVESSNGAIWDLKVVDECHIAAACESGSVVVYRIGDADLEQKYTLKPSVRGVRALSICEEGGRLFIGDGAGNISRWSKTGGRSCYSCDLTMAVERRGNQPTLIWSLAGLTDGRFVSGDSLGSVSVWDAELGVRSQLIREHQADILSLSTGPDGILFSGGVDAKISMYKTTQSALCPQDSFFMHTRDIHAIFALSDGRILSGGADGGLVIYDPRARGNFEPIKLPRLGHVNVSSSACGALHLISGGSRAAQLSVLKPEPVVLAEFDGNLSTAIIDSQGKTILLSSPNGTSIIDFNVQTLEIKKKSNCNRWLRLASFADDSKIVGVTSNSSKLVIWDYTKEWEDREEISLIGVFPTALAVSEGKVLVGGIGGDVVLIDLNSAKIISQSRVKRGDTITPVVDIEFDEHGNFLVLSGGIIGGTFLICLKSKDMEVVWRRNLSKIAKSLKTTNCAFKKILSSGSHLCVLGERCMVKGGPKSWEAVDTTGLGMVYGGWMRQENNGPAVKRLKQITPQEEVVLFSAELASFEKSLPTPFMRKAFHK